MLLKTKAHLNLYKNVVFRNRLRVKYRFLSIISLCTNIDRKNIINPIKIRALYGALNLNKNLKPIYFSTNESSRHTKGENDKKSDKKSDKKREETEKSEDENFDMDKILKELDKINDFKSFKLFFFGKGKKNPDKKKKSSAEEKEPDDEEKGEMEKMIDEIEKINSFKDLKAFIMDKSSKFNRESKNDEKSSFNDKNPENDKNQKENWKKETQKKIVDKHQKKTVKLMYFVAASITAIIMMSSLLKRRSEMIDSHTIQFQDFANNYLAKGRVKKIMIQKDKAIIVLKESADFDNEKDKSIPEPSDTDRFL